MNKDCAGLLLYISREVHPSEVVVLLHGTIDGDVIHVKEVSLPPQSIYGEGFSSFNPYALPIDFSIVGIAHSHPSGVEHPSIEDLNNFLGRIMVIVTAPYEDVEDIHVYDSKGRKLRFEIG